MDESKPSRDSEQTASSQKIAISSKGLEVGLRRFLADISPGMFLLLIIHLYDQKYGLGLLQLSGDGAATRWIFYLLVAIPSGFIVNAVGYFFFVGAIVRYLEGMMLKSSFICGRIVTICDWNEVRTFYGLGGAMTVSDYLLFRYNCESVMVRREPKWFSNFEHVGGIEILSRNIAVLIVVYVALFYYSDPHNVAVLVGLVVAVGFLVLSALDSLYLGVRCIRYLLVICKQELGRDHVPWTDVLSLMKPRSTDNSG